MEAKPNKADKQGIYWLLLVLAVLCIAGAVACWQGSDYYRGYYISERKNYSRYAMEDLERWTLVLGPWRRGSGGPGCRESWSESTNGSSSQEHQVGCALGLHFNID